MKRQILTGLGVLFLGGSMAFAAPQQTRADFNTQAPAQQQQRWNQRGSDQQAQPQFDQQQANQRQFNQQIAQRDQRDTQINQRSRDQRSQRFGRVTYRPVVHRIVRHKKHHEQRDDFRR
ncbi:MAG TPA: hypothetical protein VKU62_14095 [Thermoanaerobaculia bacterium]|nr:hypothetical protein [Thermoanaerobaculia bacterium]